MDTDTLTENASRTYIIEEGGAAKQAKKTLFCYYIIHHISTTIALLAKLWQQQAHNVDFLCNLHHVQVGTGFLDDVAIVWNLDLIMQNSTTLMLPAF